VSADEARHLRLLLRYRYKAMLAARYADAPEMRRDFVIACLDCDMCLAALSGHEVGEAVERNRRF